MMIVGMLIVVFITPVEILDMMDSLIPNRTKSIVKMSTL
jgi:hypothetical protein